MDKFADRMEKLVELSNEELEALQEEIREEFKTVSESEISSETVEAMENLHASHEAVKSELSTRSAQEAELAARAEQVMASMSDTEKQPKEEVVEEEEKKKKEDEEVEPEKIGAETDSFSTTEESSENAESVFPVEEAREEVEPGEAVTDEVVESLDSEEVVEEDPSEESEANSASEPVKKADKDTSLEEKERIIKQENAKAAKEEDPQNFEAPKDDATKEDPEKTAKDANKANKAATSVETPLEAEAAVSNETSEEDEKTEIDASKDKTPNREDETVTASANIEVPEDRKPLPSSVATRTITAGSDLPGITAGSELSDMSAVANAILGRLKGMGRTSGGDGEQHVVATFSTEFSKDRTLAPNDPAGVTERLRGAEALTAAGGLYGPVDTKYDLYGLGQASRPVRDSLPVFNAQRNGIRFLTPPVISDLAGAVGLWTLQDDIDAATQGSPDPVKPCLRVKAGEEVTVYLDAITLCLTFGNLGARAFPELVERHTELAMVWHARFAETRLLTRIGQLSTPTTTAHELGAARDVFVAVEKAAAAYRSRHRMGVKDSLHAIFPEWFKNALRADLTKQAPSDVDVTFELADTKINTWFSVRNIKVTWAEDGEEGQVFGPQATSEATEGTEAVAQPLTEFPDSVIWYLFSEGTFVFLDGGTLDLGLVRDSTLNSTNDYQIFLETFEGVAKVGIESLRIESTIKLVGSHSAATNINS